MKVNKKALKLIDKGLSSKTVSSLTEAQIDVLYSKMVLEQVKQEKKQITKTTIPASTARTTGANVDGVSIKMDAAGNVVASQTTEGEMSEQDDLDNNDALGADAMQTVTGQEAPHDEKDMAPDGMDDDSDNDREAMGEGEIKKGEPNPWAICHAQLGPKKTRKFERCVKEVKKHLKEGKNPVSLFIESQIERIVEKHMPPRITKSDLLKVISEAEPSVAPAEPGTKPDVKPPKTNPTKRPGHPGKNPDPGIKIKPKAGGSTKKSSSKEEEIVVPDKPTKPVSPDRPGEPSKPLRPAHPGRNPNPNVNPAPKAGKISPETAKDKVIDVILNILKK